ncbi:hypothetical protein YenMTG1_117 [Yersinia phage vB_YenM_TG1]|uniref:Valyl-tRNA synthetase modifier n=1 Tax=Yersinia phage vB_YenM_TG1 TaxID=1589265 RepID=A0A0B4ZXB5_9CAUD|nr:valyl tRNA synthetase modifier [Yersinia phage vB_YenM_TG1]AJD81927.1 hypothetical protein YenMTG1_117 [Yersinia phage vB_YenM_TG1]
MYKPLVVLSLILVCTSDVKADDVVWKESIKTAKLFCGSNNECVDVIALELDSAYRDGQTAINKWRTDAIKRKEKQLETFCDKAPNLTMCVSYRENIMKQFISGLQK